jgi:hypothetical protein
VGKKGWTCPRDGAVLNPGDWKETVWETKRDGRWHYAFTCRGPSRDADPHEVIVSKSGVRVTAATPKLSHKVDHGLTPAPPPPRPPRKTVIIRRSSHGSRSGD